jgi:hypothetical protein
MLVLRQNLPPLLIQNMSILEQNFTRAMLMLRQGFPLPLFQPMLTLRQDFIPPQNGNGN